MLTEPIQLLLSFLSGNRPTECGQVSRIVRESRRHLGDNLLSQGIQYRSGSFRDVDLPAPTLAVVGIVVPLTALGLVALH